MANALSLYGDCFELAFFAGVSEEVCADFADLDLFGAFGDAVSAVVMATVKA